MRRTTILVDEELVERAQGTLGARGRKSASGRALLQVVDLDVRRREVAQLRAMDGLDLDRQDAMDQAWRYGCPCQPTSVLAAALAVGYTEQTAHGVGLGGVQKATAMKRRFRRRSPPRREADTGPSEGALQFERARSRMAPLLEEARAALDDACAVGFPVVHTSTRHASLELAQDWSWSLLGRQATGPEIAVVQGDGEETIQPVGRGDAGLDEVEASFQDFLAAYRARPR